MSNQSTVWDIIYVSGGAEQPISAKSTYGASRDDNPGQLKPSMKETAAVSPAPKRFPYATDEDMVFNPKVDQTRSPLGHNDVQTSSSGPPFEDLPAKDHGSVTGISSLARGAALIPVQGQGSLRDDVSLQSDDRQDGGVKIERDDKKTIRSVETPQPYGRPRNTYDAELGWSEEEYTTFLVRNDIQRCEAFLFTLDAVLKGAKANDRQDTIALMASGLEKVIDALNMPSKQAPRPEGSALFKQSRSIGLNEESNLYGREGEDDIHGLLGQRESLGRSDRDVDSCSQMRLFNVL